MLVVRSKYDELAKFKVEKSEFIEGIYYLSSIDFYTQFKYGSKFVSLPELKKNYKIEIN